MVNIKIDLTDRKILHELDFNSRTPMSIIARRLKLSREVVNYRINKLVSEGIILKFYPIINISKLGYSANKIFIRFQNISELKEKEFIKFIENNPNIIYSASYDGKFDIVVSIWAKNVEDLANSLKELDEKFGKLIAEKETSTIIRGEYKIRNYLTDSKVHTKRELFFGSVPNKINIDEINKKILFELSRNARITAVEISDKIKLSSDAVCQRIRQLEKSGIIQNYNLVPNEQNYPFTHYKILFSLQNLNKEKEKKFLDYCKNQKNIWYFCSCLGSWNFEIDLDIESAEQFREFLREIKNNFSEIIKDYSVLTTYRTNKYNFCPSIP